ncbi:M56 family metallopeptidase [Erysipelotrichaceae bacterium 66-17]
MERYGIGMLMAGMEAWIGIGLLSYILSRKTHYRYFRSGLIRFFLFLITLRLCIPFTFLRADQLFSKWSDSLIVVILMSGMVVQGWRCFAQAWQTHQCVRVLNKTALRYIPGWKYPVRRSKKIDEPKVTGWKPVIYLPDLEWDPMELKCILLHESAHLDRHDLRKLRFVNVLKVMYWWCPGIYRYGTLVEFFLETQVDRAVAAQLEAEEYLEYAQVLLSVHRKLERISRPQTAEYESLMKACRKARRLRFLYGTGIVLLACTLVTGYGRQDGPQHEYKVKRSDGTIVHIRNGKVSEQIEKEPKKDQNIVMEKEEQKDEKSIDEDGI